MRCRQVTAQATTAVKTTVQQAATTSYRHHTTTTHYNITSTKIPSSRAKWEITGRNRLNNGQTGKFWVWWSSHRGTEAQFSVWEWLLCWIRTAMFRKEGRHTAQCLCAAKNEVKITIGTDWVNTSWNGRRECSQARQLAILDHYVQLTWGTKPFSEFY